MWEKFKDSKWFVPYFLIGYFWGLFAEMIQLTQFPDIGLFLTLIAFLINMLIWPFSMLIALFWLVF
ncbi:MAG: hypothetical protein V3W20_11705 [Candidatus Neomarinimicrobiota bacterium]